MKLFDTQLIKSYLRIREWSLLETLLAFYPIISGWRLGPFPLYLLFAVIMDLVAYSRYGLNLGGTSKKVKILFWFIMLHCLVWLFVVPDASSTYLNSWLGIVITMGSIFFVAPVIDYEKLKKPLFVFAFIVSFGLIFQLVQLARGIPIHQLTIPPFAPTRDVDVIRSVDALRPSSFLQEPAAFAQYLYPPLFIALLNRRYILSAFLIVMALLSTSTTALVICPLMIVGFLLVGSIKLKWKVAIAICAVGIGVFVARTDLFDATLLKAEETELSENERTSIGLTILPQLEPQEIAFGIPYQNVSDMYATGRLSVSTFFWYEDGRARIFVPTFWNILFLYGVIGLLLYLLVFWEIFRKSRLLFPYLVTVFARMFSDPTGLGATFMFELCFMYAFIRYEESKRIEVGGQA